MVHESSTTVTTLVVVAKTGILVLGALITYFSAKAYRRTGSSALRALAVGFAFVTLGALLGGLLDQVFRETIGLSVLADSLLTLVGLAVITYSLYTE